ncbi:PAS domain S-box protein [Chitinibacter sp. S2-10]|uniref:PAS domain S-box protein n=1 Tax=Chitinibacter sp. S2-10 TaxID=3373597 RepID=UPI0039778589
MLLIGAALILGALFLLHQQMQLATQNRLDLMAASQSAQLEERLVQQQEVLLGLQAALTLNPTLDRQQFYNLLLQSNVMYRHPGLLAVALARPVAKEQLPQHIQAVRADKRIAPLVYRHYQPSQVDGAQELLLVEHLYPINRQTESLLGNNLAAMSALKDGLALARDSGRMLASPVFKIGQDNIFCFYAPIYRELSREPAVSERRAQHVGTIVAYLRLDEVMRPLVRSIDEYDLSWQLFDQGYAQQQLGNQPRASQVMGQHFQSGQSLISNQIIHLPGRQWRLAYQSKSQLWSQQQGEWLLIIGLVGMLCLLLCAVLMQFLYSSRRWSLQMLMQAQLREYERKASERLLIETMQKSHDALIIRGTDGQIKYANDESQRLFASDSASLLGRKDAIFDAAELGGLVLPMTFTVPYSGENGHSCWLEVNLQPIRNEQLEYTGTLMQVRDVSTAYVQLLELKEAKHHLQDMVELSSDWFWEQDTEARFTMVTGGFFNRFDLPQSYFIGKRRWELGQGGLTQAEWDAHREVLAAQQPYRDFEYTSTLGRETIIVSVSGYPVFDEQGQFKGYRGIGRDVTDIRAAQKALLSEQRRAQATLDSIADGVITTDVDGRVDYLNPVASSLIGWECAAASGQMLTTIYQTVDHLHRLPMPDLVANILREGAEAHGARRSVLLNKFGLNFQIEETAARIRDEHGRTIGAVLIFRDISNWRDLDDRVELL